MKIIATIIIILSTLDVILTKIWLNFGIACEANPLMDTIIDNTMIFACTKLFLTIGGVYILKENAERGSFTAKAGLIFSLLVYVYVFSQHAIGVKYFLNF